LPGRTNYALARNMAGSPKGKLPAPAPGRSLQLFAEALGQEFGIYAGRLKLQKPAEPQSGRAAAVQLRAQERLEAVDAASDVRHVTAHFCDLPPESCT
jgi:hypothetical protein